MWSFGLVLKQKTTMTWHLISVSHQETSITQWECKTLGGSWETPQSSVVDYLHTLIARLSPLQASIHSHTCSYYTHSSLHTMSMPQNGGSNPFKTKQNLRLLWHSYLFISSLLLNSRKVTRLAFPRKWILIYSGKKCQQIIHCKANKHMLPEKCDLKIPGTSA